MSIFEGVLTLLIGGLVAFGFVYVSTHGRTLFRPKQKDAEESTGAGLNETLLILFLLYGIVPGLVYHLIRFLVEEYEYGILSNISSQITASLILIWGWTMVRHPKWRPVLLILIVVDILMFIYSVWYDPYFNMS